MSQTTLGSPPSSATKTTVWYTRCPVPTAFGVALRSGKLHEEFGGDSSVVLRSVLDSEDPAVHDSHYAGNLRNAFRQGGNIPPIWARSRGADTKVIGLSWTTTPAAVLVPSESGIRSVADLKGKRLLIVRRPDEVIDFLYAGALRIYEAVLATAGLTLSDVILVEKVVNGSTEHTRPEGREADTIHGRPRFSAGGHRNLLLPLLKGEADAIVAQGPFAVELVEGYGARVVYDLSTHPDPIARFHNSVPKVLTVNAGFLDERPDLVARVVARLLEAADWAKENVEQAVHFVALEQGSSDGLIEATYGPKLAEELELNLASDNIARLAAQKTFLLNRGFIEKDFDLNQWIDAGPLRAAHALLLERRADGSVRRDLGAPARARIGPAGCVVSR
jgi:ABC-type nitrate/sulfonate/bicarbonate transport system substrate-binding protein